MTQQEADEKTDSSSSVMLGGLVILSPVLFLIFLVSGSGFVNSVVGGLFWAAVIVWYLGKKVAEAEEKRTREQAENDELEAYNKKFTYLRRLRDAEVQDEPYDYKIGRHANETLALRYGLVNAKGYKENNTIRLRKLKKLKTDFYEVEMPKFGNRKAIAVIEPGTDYVKTFYPTSASWFTTHAQLEAKLKNNAGLSLSDIAKYHIDAALK